MLYERGMDGFFENGVLETLGKLQVPVDTPENL